MCNVNYVKKNNTKSMMPGVYFQYSPINKEIIRKIQLTKNTYSHIYIYMNNSNSKDGGRRKKQALKDEGVLNPRAESVKDELFRKHPFFDANDLIQIKYEMLRKVEKDGSTVTTAADSFGFSRPSFYEAKLAYTNEGMAGLIPKKRGPRGAHKLSEGLLDFVLKQVDEDQEVNVEKIAKLLKQKFDITVHPRSIYRALARGKKKDGHR